MTPPGRASTVRALTPLRIEVTPMKLSWKKTARTTVPAAWRPAWAVAVTALLSAMALVAVGITQEPGLDTRADQRRRERLTQSTGPASPEVATTVVAAASPTNAPTGF